MYLTHTQSCFTLDASYVASQFLLVAGVCTCTHVNRLVWNSPPPRTRTFPNDLIRPCSCVAFCVADRFKIKTFYPPQVRSEDRTVIRLMKKALTLTDLKAEDDAKSYMCKLSIGDFMEACSMTLDVQCEYQVCVRVCVCACNMTHDGRRAMRVLMHARVRVPRASTCSVSTEVCARACLRVCVVRVASHTRCVPICVCVCPT